MFPKLSISITLFYTEPPLSTKHLLVHFPRYLYFPLEPLRFSEGPELPRALSLSSPQPLEVPLPDLIVGHHSMFQTHGLVTLETGCTF